MTTFLPWEAFSQVLLLASLNLCGSEKAVSPKNCEVNGRSKQSTLVIRERIAAIKGVNHEG